MSESRKEALAERNLWNELIELRDTQRRQQASGLQVIKERDLPLEKNSMGYMRWYMHPGIKDTVLNTLIFFQQEIPPGSRSGRLRFQGGQVIMILEGRGYTVIDGVKHAWKAGDVLNLPLRSDGITVQHFNTDTDLTAKFVAAEPNWVDCVGVDRGCGFDVLPEAPNDDD